MPLQLQPIPSVNFINPAGVPDVADAELFASEASMDTAIDALVPDKDKPFLTQNDKVFATRYAASLQVTSGVQSVDDDDDDCDDDDDGPPYGPPD